MNSFVYKILNKSSIPVAISNVNLIRNKYTNSKFKFKKSIPIFMFNRYFKNAP